MLAHSVFNSQMNVFYAQSSKLRSKLSYVCVKPQYWVYKYHCYFLLNYPRIDAYLTRRANECRVDCLLLQSLLSKTGLLCHSLKMRRMQLLVIPRAIFPPLLAHQSRRFSTSVRVRGKTERQDPVVRRAIHWIV